MAETVVIPRGTNWRDLVVKTFWTVGLIAALTAAENVELFPGGWWTPLVALFAQPVIAWLRQQQGATPPTLPAVGPVGETLPDALTGPPPATRF
jgi:hypothetical protein